MVGSDQPQALHQDDEHSRVPNSITPEGFTRGRFSAALEPAAKAS